MNIYVIDYKTLPLYIRDLFLEDNKGEKMKIIKQIVALTVLMLFLAIPAMTIVQGEQYSDELNDDEGDVNHMHSNGWEYNVERPNIDIIRSVVSESGGTVTISLSVKGVITDHANITYYLYLEDGEDGFYMITYTDEYCQIWASNDQGYSIYEKDADGVGTDTLTVTTTLEELLNPDLLKLDEIYVYDYYTYGEYYWDSASADDDNGDFIPIDYELEVEPTMGQAPLEVDITVSAENTGDAAGQIPITVDSSTIDIMELGAQEWDEHYTSYTFEEAGTYTVEFGDRSITMYIQDQDNDDDEMDPYSDMITDLEGDVMRMMGATEDEWEFVESPNVDIKRVELSENGGVVTVSMRVKGTITDHDDIYYEIFLKDDGDGFFEIHYTNGDAMITAYTGTFGSNFEPTVNGVGTDTLSFVFSREQIGNPNVLEVSWAIALDEEQTEADMAGPDAEYPPGYVDPGDDDENGDDENGNGDDEDGSTEDDETKDVDEDTPGFAFVMLVVSISSAVLIYRKKRREP